MAAKTAAYETALLGILQNEGSLVNFLDVVFGFLSSKTDFFCVMKHEKQSYGFPAGAAKDIVLQSFEKYEKLRQRADMEHAENVDKQIKETKKIEASSMSSGCGQTTATVKSATRSKIDEPTPTTQEEFQQNADSYNGAVRDNYSWSQNYDDVDVRVNVPSHIKKAKQVKVNIQRKFISVGFEDEDRKINKLVEGELHQQIKLDESLWSLEPSKAIQITLTKDKAIWWKTLITSEEEIDLKKIKAERPMADLGDEEKQVVNKLQFDERQKRLGKPQSHELKVHEMLKKGWNCEGSPFKGQEFDPKMFNISPNAVSP